MRVLAAILCLLLAGCAGPSDDADASSPPAAPPQDAAPDPLLLAPVLAPSPLYINGTLDSVGPCALPDGQQPGELPAGQDLQPVPQAAWNRTYEGPDVGSADVNVAQPCVVWLDAAGERIPEVPDGKVPAGTTQVAVQGMAQVGASYTIKVT